MPWCHYYVEQNAMDVSTVRAADALLLLMKKLQSRVNASQNNFVLSFLRQLTTWHSSHLPLSAGHAAIDRYLLAAGPTVANQRQRRSAAM